MARNNAVAFLNIVISGKDGEYSLAGKSLDGTLDTKGATILARKVVKKIHNLATSLIPEAETSATGEVEITFEKTGDFLNFLKKNHLTIKLVVRDMNYQPEAEDDDSDIEL